MCTMHSRMLKVQEVELTTIRKTAQPYRCKNYAKHIVSFFRFEISARPSYPLSENVSLGSRAGRRFGQEATVRGIVVLGVVLTFLVSGRGCGETHPSRQGRRRPGVFWRRDSQRRILSPTIPMALYCPARLPGSSSDHQLLGHVVRSLPARDA